MALCCLSNETNHNRRGKRLQNNNAETLLQESPKTTRTVNTMLRLSDENMQELDSL